MTPSAPAPTRGGRWLVAVAIVLLAANLRVAVGSIGVVLESVRDDLAMTATVGGVLTTLPVVCFAVFGWAPQGSCGRLGLHLSAALLLAMIAIGLVSRSLVDNQVLFLLCSTIALAGAAVGNVILPPLVKAHFPIASRSSARRTASLLMAGASLSSIATVPLSHALGGWRGGLAAWAALAAIALVPWSPTLRGDVHAAPVEHDRLPLRDVMRSRVAWAMLLLFGTQSAARTPSSAGSPRPRRRRHQRGLCRRVAGLDQRCGNPVDPGTALADPRSRRYTPYLPWGFAAVTAGGWFGVLLAPDRAMAVGRSARPGGGAFTWTLTMIARRTRTTAGTATRRSRLRASATCWPGSAHSVSARCTT
ncbi:CynX/NimT family MFS transporter [Aeromicrobium sp. UC242_57]|uniref:CynX/NimT family MFS transporter n=1 Tax=Aeromicrobium sp. UC242_57 TaxID=3374624 RepID=UPI0037B471A7